MTKYLALGAAALFSTAEGIDLTSDNFDASIEGKNALVKFFAPWCGHCKRLKPAYDQLASEFEDHATVVIGDVDCTVHQPLCSKYGVRGYPTLKYWKDGNEGAYQSGRDYDALKKLVDETLA